MYAVLSIMISACSAPIVDTFGSISGVVLDEKTNDPLAGVTVSLSPSGHSPQRGGRADADVPSESIVGNVGGKLAKLV